MKPKKIWSNEKGAVLIGTILVLVAISAIGATLITLSIFELDMATNEKCAEEARYNSESGTVSSAKLVRMVSERADDEGTLGIPQGGTLTAGIVYPDSDAGAFARKVMGFDDDPICEDVFLAPANVNMSAGADIRPTGATATIGTAANVQAGGYSYGVGLGAAGGGGASKWFIIASLGPGCGTNARHISYSRYRKVLGVAGGM